MRTQQWVGSIAEIRERLIGAKGVRDEVAFQNDVNALLSAVADLEAPVPKLPHGIEAPFGLLPTVAQQGRGPAGRFDRARSALSQLTKGGKKRKSSEHLD